VSAERSDDHIDLALTGWKRWVPIASRLPTYRHQLQRWQRSSRQLDRSTPTQSIFAAAECSSPRSYPAICARIPARDCATKRASNRPHIIEWVNARIGAGPERVVRWVGVVVMCAATRSWRVSGLPARRWTVDDIGKPGPYWADSAPHRNSGVVARVGAARYLPAGRRGPED
jgi:hypothetical protein